MNSWRVRRGTGTTTNAAGYASCLKEPLNQQNIRNFRKTRVLALSPSEVVANAGGARTVEFASLAPLDAPLLA